MIKNFFVDENNRFVFNTKYSESDKKLEVIDGRTIEEVELSVLKNDLLNVVRLLCSNKKSILNVNVVSNGFIRTSNDIVYSMTGFIHVIENEAFELYGFVADLNAWIPMREYMPYDLIDFLSEFKE